MAVKVGVGYLKVQPEISAGDFAAEMNRRLSGTLTKASKEIGAKSGTDMGASMATQAAKATGEKLPKELHEKVTPKARRAGEEAGLHFGEGMTERARGGLSKLGSLVGIGLASFAVGEVVKSSLEAATTANKAARITTELIGSTGGAAKVTAEHLHEYGESLAGLTGVSAAHINQAQNLLLTFTNIRNETGKGNDVFDQATKASLNMATVMGEDASTAAMQLGKALNDPVKGVTALRRAGVQLSDQQTDQVKKMVASGNTLGAQKIILGEVQKEFGNAAAAGSTGMGRLSAMVEILKEKLGNLLLPVIQGLVGFLTKYGLPALEGFIAGLKGTGGESEGIAGKLKKVGEFVRGLAIQIRDRLLPPIVSAVKALLPLVLSAVRAALPEIKKVIDTVFTQIAIWLPRIVAAIKALLPIVVAVFKALWPYRAIIIGIIGAFLLWHKTAMKVNEAKKAFDAFKTSVSGMKKLFEGGLLSGGWLGIIVVGIAVAVIAFIYAYKHFKGFHDFVNKAIKNIGIWSMWLWHKAIKPAFDGIAQGAEWLWTKALKPAFKWIAEVGFPAVATGATWLWKHVLKPAFEGIAVVAMWLWEHALKPLFHNWKLVLLVVGGPVAILVALIVRYWRQIAAVSMWLWRNVLQPAFKGIAATVMWLWSNAIKPVIFGFVIPAFKLLWAGIKLYVGFIIAALKVEFAIVMWVWHHIFKPVIFGFIIPAFKLLWAGIKLYVGFIAAVLKVEFAIVMWVWHHILKPVIFGFIIPAFKLLWAGIKIYVGFIVGVFKVIGIALKIVWNFIIWPIFKLLELAFKGIGFALKIVWNFVIWPIFKLLELAIKGAAFILTWLWKHVVAPVIAAIGDLFAWLWKVAIKPAIEAIGAVAMWLWHHVFEPVFQGIAAVAHWLWENAIKPVIGFMVDAFHGFEKLLNWLWHNIFEPVFQGIGAVMSWLWDKAIRPVIDAIKGAFEDAVSWIGKVWSGLGDVLMVPVKFIVNTIYNDGIRRAWNYVAHVAHFDELPAFTIGDGKSANPSAAGGSTYNSQVPRYATGGIVPGTGSGDIVPALLEPNERVLSRAQVAMLGGHAAIDAMVGRGTGRDGFFQGGGIVDQIPGLSAVLDLVQQIPGKGPLRDGLVKLMTGGLEKAAGWILAFPGAKQLLGLGEAVVSDAEKLWGKVFDTGGWLGTGRTLVSNNTGRPEAVLRPQAVDALGGSGVVNALNSGRRPFGDVNVTVNNPIPEKASVSVPVAMRALAFQLTG